MPSAMSCEIGAWGVLAESKFTFGAFSPVVVAEMWRRFFDVTSYSCSFLRLS